jgi:hypothetical protein
MLLRLLVAVLALVGPMPCRICTCATEHAPGAAHVPATHVVKNCANHAHDTSAEAAMSGGGATEHDAECDGVHHPLQHERDCPAINPHPPIREAVPQSASNASADARTACPGAWVARFPDDSVPTAVSFGPPRALKSPLYLVLLSLRN